MWLKFPLLWDYGMMKDQTFIALFASIGAFLINIFGSFVKVWSAKLR